MTRNQVKKNGKSYPQTISEEHYALVREPMSEYLGHVTPESGTSKNIHKCIANFLDTKGIDTRDIVAIGCDGTNVNTGANGGIVHLIET